MLETFSQSRLQAAGPHEMSDALENAKIVYFPECPVDLPDATDLESLRKQLPAQLERKNASYYPQSDKVRGLRKGTPLQTLSRRVLKHHSRVVSDFLNQAMPDLFSGVRIGTSSFRPLEERGRNLKPHASNELIHVDAGAYGATNGDRILRFFVNVNPTEDRVWVSKGSFWQLFEEYGEQAGLNGTGKKSGHLDKSTMGRLRTSILKGISRVGVPQATVIDSSPYDRAMRKFHNFMKDSPAFQHDLAHRQEYRFPPYSAWMVLTDAVSHACLSGRHALTLTCLVPLGNCRHPELAPFNILSQAS
jgi:hypothetical protein